MPANCGFSRFSGKQSENYNLILSANVYPSVGDHGDVETDGDSERIASSCSSGIVELPWKCSFVSKTCDKKKGRLKRPKYEVQTSF